MLAIQNYKKLSNVFLKNHLKLLVIYQIRENLFLYIKDKRSV